MGTDKIEARLQSLEIVVDGLTAKLRAVGALLDTQREQEAPVNGFGILQGLTKKQHATLQMLVRGASNREIGERFGVTENTAKVHVRGVAKKFGVHSRAQIVIEAMPALQTIGSELYERISGGLSLSWDYDWDGEEWG